MWRPTTWSSQTTTHDLDLGQLRHAAVSRRGVGPRGCRPSGPDVPATDVERVPGLLGGLLLGLLLRPRRGPRRAPPRRRRRGRGTPSRGRVPARRRGTPVTRAPTPAAISCRLVFQSRPAPSVAASSMMASKWWCTKRAATSMSVDEEHRADERLEGVGEDRGLVAAAGRLLALAEHDVLPEVERPGDVGERAHVDDGRAQLGQLPLGEVGVLAVERLGDDETQHGVTEELEALVVGQAAVLVGVRAVRQGTQKQRLVDVLADHLAEVGDQSIDGPLRHRRNTPSAQVAHGAAHGVIRPGARCARRRRSDGPCTCHTRGTRCAAGLPHRTGGTWSASSALPSSSHDANGCWSATSSASGQPRQFLFSCGSLLSSPLRDDHLGSITS